MHTLSAIIMWLLYIYTYVQQWNMYINSIFENKNVYEIYINYGGSNILNYNNIYKSE